VLNVTAYYRGSADQHETWIDIKCLEAVMVLKFVLTGPYNMDITVDYPYCTFVTGQLRYDTIEKFNVD